jgi:hypothetical protein
MPCVPAVRAVSAEPSPPEGAAEREPCAAQASRRAWQVWAERLAPLLGLLLALVPGWVLACPTCVAKAPESRLRSALLVGAMLLLPFLLVAVGVWAAIRAARGDAKRSS